MTRQDGTTGTAATRRERLQDLGLRGVVGALNLLPVRARLDLAGWLGRSVLGPALGWPARIAANLDHVWPDTDAATRAKITRGAIDNLARALIENYDPAEMRRRAAAYPVGGPGLAVLHEAREQGQPVMLISGHYGSPICARSALVSRGFAVAGFLRPMSNPLSNARYVQNYRDVAEPVFEQGRRGTMGLVRHLRDGGICAMAFDVFDGDGAAIPFLGQPAPTSLAPAEIALKTGAVFLPYFGIRRPDGYGFDAILEAPIPRGDPLEMMTEVTARLEARIHQDPGQWLWTHRRWKPKRQMKRQRKRAAAKMDP
jgi:KDO2-lipid IV(A) lauroyltransferase